MNFYTYEGWVDTLNQIKHEADELLFLNKYDVSFINSILHKTGQQLAESKVYVQVPKMVS